MSGSATWASAWATAALLFLGCGDDIATNSDKVGDGSDDEDREKVFDDNDDEPRTNALGPVAMPGIAEWTDVHDVQIIDRPGRVEIRAMNARRELIGRIVIESDGAWLRVSSEYADGGFAVEVIADTGLESYDLIYQTLEADELMARAAAIDDLLYNEDGPQGKWLACGVFATSVIPACLGAWAPLACIPATVVAGCKCTKAALDLPDEEAGICENI